MATWTANMASGDPDLDDVHEMIAASIDHALSAIERSSSSAPSELGAAFEAIVAHFREEEELMTRCAFPGAGEHRAAHALFISDLTKLRDLMEERGAGPPVSIWLSSRIRSWFQQHTRGPDMALARFAAARPAIAPQQDG